MTLRYKLSTFIRAGLGLKANVDLRVDPETTEGISNNQWHISILLDEHEMDWPDEIAIPEAGKILPHLSSTFLQQFESHVSEVKGNLTVEMLMDTLASAYREIDAIAERTQIAASALVVCWMNYHLHVASVGACRAYLISTGRIKQLSVDDFTYITEGGITYTLTNILSNSLGRGKIKTANDIHFSTHDIKSQDLILICNTTFYENVSDEEILNTSISFADLDELCHTLGTKASQNAGLFNSISLCGLRFEGVKDFV